MIAALAKWAPHHMTYGKQTYPPRQLANQEDRRCNLRADLGLENRPDWPQRGFRHGPIALTFRTMIRRGSVRHSTVRSPAHARQRFFEVRGDSLDSVSPRFR